LLNIPLKIGENPQKNGDHNIDPRKMRHMKKIVPHFFQKKKDQLSPR
jgi:hypothetical protein